MNKIEINLKDCYILEPKRFGDTRGYFESGIEDTANWYVNNQEWIDDIKSGEYQKAYKR